MCGSAELRDIEAVRTGAGAGLAATRQTRRGIPGEHAVFGFGEGNVFVVGGVHSGTQHIRDGDAERACPFALVTGVLAVGGAIQVRVIAQQFNIAEPNALIGFAGARVAAGTTGDELPEGFQRSEFLFRHGFLDQVVPRAELRDRLAVLLRYLTARPAPMSASAISKGWLEPGQGGLDTNHDRESTRG